MISELKPGERLDDLERNGLMLIQHPGRFCYGVDAVLLSWFAKASEGERVLDFCTGTGVVPILMTAKTAASHFTGLEIQEEVAKMASRCELINPQVKPAPQELQDKHYYRKHGANAYYGQIVK